MGFLLDRPTLRTFRPAIKIGRSSFRLLFPFPNLIPIAQLYSTDDTQSQYDGLHVDVYVYIQQYKYIRTHTYNANDTQTLMRRIYTYSRPYTYVRTLTQTLKETNTHRPINTYIPRCTNVHV